MTTILTTAEIRGFVTTKLLDANLEILVEAADYDITELLGPLPASVGDPLTVDVNGGYRSLILPQLAATITSITERTGGEDPATVPEVSPESYRLDRKGQTVRREQPRNGSAPSWGGVVRVVYAPVDTTADRRRALVEMVRVSLSDRGVQSESSGSITRTFVDTRATRRRILNELIYDLLEPDDYIWITP